MSDSDSLSIKQYEEYVRNLIEPCAICGKDISNGGGFVHTYTQYTRKWLFWVEERKIKVPFCVQCLIDRSGEVRSKMVEK